jgi:hypothetical protein
VGTKQAAEQFILPKWGKEYDNKTRIIVESEIGLSTAIIQAGFKIASLQSWGATFQPSDCARLCRFNPTLQPQDPFELIFLDADKKRSWEYLELIVSRQLLAPHGLLLIDNVLWKGEVLARLDPAAVCATSAAASSLTPSARRSRELRDALHAFSTRLAADERMDQLLLPLRVTSRHSARRQ